MQCGSYKVIKFKGEEVNAYIPSNLENIAHDITIDLSKIDKINRSLGKLDAMHDILPNINLFVYLYVRKEALLSSQIEGTQSSLTDVFSYETYKVSSTPKDDVEEVTNYIQAIKQGVGILENQTLPVCSRLLKELHMTLLQGVRGKNHMPGEFRRSQNWIGGTRPGNAYFVPPPPEYIDALMSDLEKFINESNVSPIVKIALVHAQFETIHPFLDGNGRLGRLLITLLLCEYDLIKTPILYISYYMKSKQSEYYQKLQKFRSGAEGVRQWVNFFLDALDSCAYDSFIKIVALEQAIRDDVAILQSKGSTYKMACKVFDVLKKTAAISMPDLAQKLGVTLHTIIRAISQLESLGVVQEITGKKSKRIYSYKQYVDLLET